MVANNCTIQAKNKQKAYIIANASYFGGNNVIWKDVVFYNTITTNVIPGTYNTYKHSLDSCLSTQRNTLGNTYPNQARSIKYTLDSHGEVTGMVVIKNCTFDYQYKGPSYLLRLMVVSIAVFENNTFYIRVKHSQYNLMYNVGSAVLKKQYILY